MGVGEAWSENERAGGEVLKESEKQRWSATSGEKKMSTFGQTCPNSNGLVFQEVFANSTKYFYNCYCCTQVVHLHFMQCL